MLNDFSAHVLDDVEHGASVQSAQEDSFLLLLAADCFHKLFADAFSLPCWHNSDFIHVEEDVADALVQTRCFKVPVKLLACLFFVAPSEADGTVCFFRDQADRLGL